MMKVMRRMTVLAAVAVAAIDAASANAAERKVQFSTPSGNIVCVYVRDNIACAVLSEPIPSSRRATVHVYRIVHATPSYSDDYARHDYVHWPAQGLFRELGYGRALRLNPSIVCVSRRIGLRCTARSGHGFFLSRKRQQVF
jgi:hypothetical protein